jgi:hypothetical protein
MLPCTATESDCTSTALFADPRLSGVPLAGAMAMVEIAPFTEFHTFAKHEVDSTHLLKWARDPRNRFSRRFLPQQRRRHALATRRASVGGEGCQSQPRVLLRDATGSEQDLIPCRDTIYKLRNGRARRRWNESWLRTHHRLRCDLVQF